MDRCDRFKFEKCLNPPFKHFSQDAAPDTSKEKKSLTFQRLDDHPEMTQQTNAASHYLTFFFKSHSKIKITGVFHWKFLLRFWLRHVHVSSAGLHSHTHEGQDVRLPQGAEPRSTRRWEEGDEDHFVSSHHSPPRLLWTLTVPHLKVWAKVGSSAPVTITKKCDRCKFS